ncbi:MAG: hypothetical protein ABEH40_06420 [Haloferacaceae archaeon]
MQSRPLACLLLLLLLPATAAGVGGTAGAPGVGAAGAPAVADDGRVRLSVSAALADGAGAVALTVRYRVPDRVTDLTLSLPVAAANASRVTELRRFRRTNATTFEWTGAGDPRIELALDAGARRVRAGDGWALVVEPDTATSYGYRGDDPGFASSFAAAEGYASGSFALLGPYRTTEVVAGGERTTFVVADAAGPVAVSGAASFLRLAPGRFDLGVRRNATTAFVIPDRSEPGTGPRIVGSTVRSSLWVGPAAVRPNATDVTFVHEYVHTRLGPVGEGSARWLTEATAEYFGHAFGLNAGIGDYGAFRRGLDPERFGTDPGSVVLARPDTWAGPSTPYAKGAFVLAALDAEIRRRTDGRYALADVFAERPGPYGSTAAFRRAVVATTGAESLSAWIDRYATTGATPSMPEEPSLFVYGPDLDPDGDGATSGTERERGTNPFAPPPATATPTEPGGGPTAGAGTGTAVPTPAPGTGDTTAGRAGGFGAVAAAAALCVVALWGHRLAARRR